MTSLFKQRSKSLWIKNKIGTLLIPDSLERISACNRLKDYGKMMASSDKELWKLHERLENIRNEMSENYTSYDYGNGYYYQSMPSLNISGYRDTADRIEKLNLKELVSDKTVLDVGSNTGFILLTLAQEIKKGIGIELNPYLVSTAKEVQKYLGAENIEFIPTPFENYDSNDIQFDVILSLANHSTYDGNTQQTLESYFQSIFNLLSINGIFIFESHPPQHEPNEKLEKTISVIEKYFDIKEKPQITMKGFLDKNRTYIIAIKKHPG